MINDLIIVGAGGFGRGVAWLTERINQYKSTWNLIGFLDDDPLKKKVTYPILGSLKDAVYYRDSFFVCAVGAPIVRKSLVSRLKEFVPDAKFATLIDPTVEISSSVKVGEGTVICAHSILTVDVSIGKHVIINLNCTVGHDVILQDYVTAYPSVNISGAVYVGYASEIGTGTQIIQNKRIGNHTVIGAGSVVICDIIDDCVAVGVPAKQIKPFN